MTGPDQPRPDRPDPDGPEPRRPDPDAGRTPPAVLAEILAHKRSEVERAKAEIPFAEIEAAVAQAEPPRNFFRAVTRPPSGSAAGDGGDRGSQASEPLAGLIREAYGGDGFEPERIARAYADAGASAISCLTDEKFFGGHLSFIERIKESVGCRCSARTSSSTLAALGEPGGGGGRGAADRRGAQRVEIVDMLILAQRLGMTVLLEVHSMDNLLRVRPHVGFPHPTYCLLGINNRDLTTMTTDLQHTIRLADMVEDTSVLVSESGIKTPDDLAKLREVGVRIVLVGEHLMRQESPGDALRALLGDLLEAVEAAQKLTSFSADVTVGGAGGFADWVPSGEGTVRLAKDPDADQPGRSVWYTRVDTSYKHSKDVELVPDVVVLRAPDMLAWIDHEKKVVNERGPNDKSSTFRSVPELFGLPELTSPEPYARDLREATSWEDQGTETVNGVECDVVLVRYDMTKGDGPGAAR
jgi:indole-3-glycerol phosphate synthase